MSGNYSITALCRMWCAVFTDFPLAEWSEIIGLADFPPSFNSFSHLKITKCPQNGHLKLKCQKDLLSPDVLSPWMYFPRTFVSKHFVPSDVFSRRVLSPRRFVPTDVVSLRMFCPWIFCPWTSCLQAFCLQTLCLGTLLLQYDLITLGFAIGSTIVLTSGTADRPSSL